MAAQPSVATSSNQSSFTPLAIMHGGRMPVPPAPALTLRLYFSAKVAQLRFASLPEAKLEVRGRVAIPAGACRPLSQ
jgi:hypothetical protein